LRENSLEFLSGGTKCRGTLYTSNTASNALPCIVMAHGFALTHASGLMSFKNAFCDAGYAVFAFDYRHFGESGGEPRQVCNPWREVEDWLTATNHIRQIDGVDGSRICLWGTSFSGGLVTVAAARDRNVQCIIAQCPLMDGAASVLDVMRYGGIGQGLRLSYHATLDLLRRVMGMSPHYLGAAGHPGDAAFMTSEDSWDGYVPMLADNAPNKVAAGIGALLPLFRPIAYAHKVKCPALVLICEKDTVASPSVALKAARKMQNAEVRRYDVGHFDVYRGEPLTVSIKDQLAFLGRVLPTYAR
jgi:pimeloyl-ACP methyl ester carboxylesterase